MWPVTKAFDDAANPSNDAPHSPPNPLRSCFSGDILQCDVRLWPPGQIPTGAPQAPHWTDNSQPSPPFAGRGHGSVSPPTSPPHLADADGFWRPPVASRPQPPRDLYCHRARRSSARLLHAATDSRSRRCARDAGLGVPGRYTQGALFPGHAAPCSTVPPTGNAHPTLPADAETNKDVPSRRHRQSSYGAARHRFWSTTPRPTGDACDRLGMLWEPRLCPGGLYPCVHSLGRKSRWSTRVWPLLETYPKYMAT